MRTIHMWWHRRVRRHEIHVRSITPPMFDPGARGRLATCACGEVWAW